jgi:hypothetical protein
MGRIVGMRCYSYEAAGSQESCLPPSVLAMDCVYDRELWDHPWLLDTKLLYGQQSIIRLINLWPCGAATSDSAKGQQVLVEGIKIRNLSSCL